MLFELHIRHDDGYIDMHIPSKLRNYINICFDWQVGKFEFAIGSSVREKERHWIQLRYKSPIWCREPEKYMKLMKEIKITKE